MLPSLSSVTHATCDIIINIAIIILNILTPLICLDYPHVITITTIIRISLSLETHFAIYYSVKMCIFV